MSMKTLQAKLAIEDLQQLKWLLGGVLALLSLWALSGLDLIDRGLSLAVVVVIVVALLKPKLVYAIPSAVWSRIVAPLILFIVIVDFALGFVSFLSPLMRMVVLLLAYRALTPRNRREDLQMLLLCMFGIVISGAITVSLLFAVQMLLFTPVAMLFLLVMCLLDRGAEAATYNYSWNGFSWRRLSNRVWDVVDLRVFSIGGLFFALVVLLSTVFFILIPRFDLANALPLAQMETQFRSGFSETVSLNAVSEITQDRSIALRIDVPDLSAIRSLPYWRILVLDSYQNGEFRLSRAAENYHRYAKLRELSKWTKRNVPRRPLTGEQWTFYFEGSISRYLPLPTLFYKMRFTKPQELKLFPDLHVVGLDVVQKSTFSYQIEDPRWDLRVPASTLERKLFHHYAEHDTSKEKSLLDYPLTTLALSLSAKDIEWLSALNKTLISSQEDLSVAEYSQRITEYLRKNFRYSLKAEMAEGSGDPVVNWLKNGKSGHCELYASAFVLLAREAGYPARMVVGFAGGSWNAVENFFVVRNSDAHAWVEIYDYQASEWLRVDPTPGESAIDPELVLPANFKFETGMQAWLDGLRMQWYRRVISFDQNDQTELATSLMDLGDTFLKQLSAYLKELGAFLKTWISQPFSYQNLMRLGIVLVACLSVFLLWRFSFSWSSLLFRLFRKPQQLSPVRKKAAYYLERMRLKQEDTHLDEAYLESLQTLYAQLQALRFGPDTTTRAAMRVFKQVSRALHNRTGKIHL